MHDHPPLDTTTAPDDPSELFAHWYRAALDTVSDEPTAVALATVGAGGRPAARMVLLKGFDEAGFVFYTNFSSRKGAELDANPHADLASVLGNLPHAVDSPFPFVVGGSGATEVSEC